MDEEAVSKREVNLVLALIEELERGGRYFLVTDSGPRDKGFVAFIPWWQRLDHREEFGLHQWIGRAEDEQRVTYFYTAFMAGVFGRKEDAAKEVNKLGRGVVAISIGNGEVYIKEDDLPPLSASERIESSQGKPKEFLYMGLGLPGYGEDAASLTRKVVRIPSIGDIIRLYGKQMRHLKCALNYEIGEGWR